MNFWKRYPADYQRKTARLTLAQHGAYTLLLDELYTAEQPLPADMGELIRVCRAMSAPEREAVRFVVDRFFPVGPDGTRHNKRAAEELEEAAPAVKAARENGRKGGRPAKPKKEPSGNPVGSENKTQKEPSSKAPQSSDNSPSLRSGETATRLPYDWQMPELWRAWARAERPELDVDRAAANFADYWHAKPGKDGRKLDWLATFRKWVRDERVAPSAASETPYQRSMRERAGEVHPAIARKAPGQTAVNPMEVLDGLTRIAR